MTVCPFDVAVDADECCGTSATDCCDGLKAECAVVRAYDANGDVDVVVCATGHGCNVYGDNMPPEAADMADVDQATKDAWTRLDEAEVEDANGYPV